MLLVVENSSSYTESEDSEGGGESEEECPPLGGGEDGGGPADESPAVEGDGDGEETGCEGSGEGKGGTKGAEERGGKTPEVEQFRGEQNVWDFCEAEKTVYYEKNVDGRLVHFAPYSHKDQHDDKKEKDTAGDAKHLKLDVLPQEAGGVKHVISEIPVNLHDGLERH